MHSHFLLPLLHYLDGKIESLPHLQGRNLCGRKKSIDWRGYPTLTPGIDLSLTEEEKKERINITQQRSASTPSVGDEIFIFNNENKIILEAINKDDLVFIHRFMCAKKANSFLSEIRGSKEFQKQINDAKEQRGRPYLS